MQLLLADTLTGTILAAPRLLDLGYADELNGPGSLTATIPAADWNAVPTANRYPAAVCAYLLDEEAPRANPTDPPRIAWNGIVWQAPLSVASSTRRIVAQGFLSALNRRIIRTDLAYGDPTPIEQTTIATNLLTAAQTGTRRALNITATGIPTTGRTRTDTHKATDRRSYGRALTNLANLDDGFLFRFTAEWSGASIVRRFRVTYPATGTVTPYKFGHGVNCTIDTINFDAANLADTVDALGADGANKLVQTATNTPPAVIPGFDSVLNFPNVNRTATLLAHANRAAQLAELPRQYPPSIAVYNTARAGVELAARITVYGPDLPTAGVDVVVTRRTTRWTAGARSLSETLDLVPADVFAAA